MFQIDTRLGQLIGFAPKTRGRDLGCTRLRVIGKPSTMSRTALVHHPKWTQNGLEGEKEAAG